MLKDHLARPCGAPDRVRRTARLRWRSGPVCAAPRRHLVDSL